MSQRLEGDGKEAGGGEEDAGGVDGGGAGKRREWWSRRGGTRARKQEQSKLSKQTDGCGTLAYDSNKQWHHALCPGECRELAGLKGKSGEGLEETGGVMCLRVRIFAFANKSW